MKPTRYCEYCGHERAVDIQRYEIGSEEGKRTMCADVRCFTCKSYLSSEHQPVKWKIVDKHIFVYGKVVKDGFDTQYAAVLAARDVPGINIEIEAYLEQ